MAGWRDRGYVVDSDEEYEASSDTNSQIPTLEREQEVVECQEQGDDVEAQGSHGVVAGAATMQKPKNHTMDGLFGMLVEKGTSQTPGWQPWNLEEAVEPHGVAVGYDYGDGEAPLRNGNPFPKANDEAENARTTPVVQQAAETVDDVPQIPSIPGNTCKQIIPNEETIPHHDSTSRPFTEPPFTQVSDLGQPTSITMLYAPNQPSNPEHDDLPPVSELLDLDPLQIRNQVQILQNSRVESEKGKGPVRALRQRKPVQLHPYAIEGEKYRQTLKARGVVPLRIGQVQADMAKSPQEESELRFSDTEEHSQLPIDSAESQDHFFPSSPRSSPPAENVQRPVGQLLPNLAANDREDFPDVDTLLRHHHRVISVLNGHKRRKVRHMYPNQRSNLELSSPATQSVDRCHLETRIDGDQDLFEVPPSPPLSGNSEIRVPVQRKANKFRFPRGISPIQLQTPIASSESRPGQVLEISKESDSEIDEATSDMDSNAGDVYSPSVLSSPQLPSKVAPPDLQRVQRTIKGVLPASWLRLDLKKQAGMSDQQNRGHRSQSPEDHHGRPGIARRVARSGMKAPILSMPLTIDTDSDSVAESKNLEQSRVPRPISSHISIRASHSTGHEWDVHMDNDKPVTLGEAVEEDRIDAMFTASRSPTKRPAKRREIERNRRSRLSSSNKIQKPYNFAHTSFKGTRSVRSHQPKIIRHPKNVPSVTHRDRQFIVPKLSIIDTLSVDGTVWNSLPPFVRIAARTSSLRNDKGRHSPSRKYIQLATWKDTEDANETLCHWRDGKIAPRVLTSTACARGDFSLRSPLQEISNNGIKLGKRHCDFDNGEPPVKLSRPTSSSRKRYQTQTSLDGIIRKTSIKSGGQQMGKRLKPAKPTRRPSAENSRGQLWSSLRNPDDLRPAQLESFATSDPSKNVLQTSRQDFLTIRQSRYEPHASGLLLAKFFNDQDAEGSRQRSNRPEQTELPSDGSLLASKTVFPHKARKRHPRQANVGVTCLKNNSRLEEIIDVPSDHDMAPKSSVEETAVLIGLEDFGTHYSIDFGIAHLPAGQFLAKRTFVGSGEFAKSLNLCKLRSLDDPAGCESFQYRNTLLEWGPWNEAVYSELSAVVNGVYTHSEEQPYQIGEQCNSLHHADNNLRYIIRYFSEHLYFLDPIDRVSFLQRCRTLMLTIIKKLDDDIEVFSVTTSNNELFRQLRLRIFLLALVIANQLGQISKHVLVPMTVGKDILLLVNVALRKTVELTLQGCYEEFPRSFQGFRTGDSSDQGTSFTTCRVEAFLVARDIANHFSETKQAFNGVLEEQITGPLNNSINVKDIEKGWANLFSLLPMLGIDSFGYVTSDGPQDAQQEHWEIVKRLSSQVFCVYMANPRGQGPTFNAYCRAIFGRCLHLINFWGWHRCEAIIGTLFDFFARRKLAHLRNERSHGSPLFLEKLDSNPKLLLAAEDLCFHILLKVIGNGLRHLRRIVPEKKIRDLVWRLMPNHGRLYPKDESVKQGDLDALRNHHDLLCTLYWASPVGLRPRVSAVQNLVDLASSHQEACHINIRAWSNLIRFQLSSDEDVTNLLPFGKWHRDLLGQLLRLHHVARTEVEEQARNARNAGTCQVSKEVVESTISKNQRHVESIIMDALVSLRNAVSAARGQEAATILLNSSLTEVFELFSATRPRTNEIVMHALDVVQAYSEHTMFKASQKEPQDSSEKDDSQDYGDWSLFTEDVTSISNSHPAAEHLLRVVHEPLRQLLSNCFGADDIPEDQLLSRLVDTWVFVARRVIDAEKASWNDYIGSFGQATWTSLRDTEHARRHTAYFLAKVVELDKSSINQHKVFFLKSWIASLVEREGLIKYQNQLTASLLNAVPDESLLVNLPFYKDPISGKLIISASDFRSRRIMLISSLLSNMRISIEAASFEGPSEVSQLRQEYREYLKHLMAAMKHNYQELGPSADVSGSYVNFLHQVIEFLQQYTSEICPIDRFFTDSTGFRLPARDPTYVVGRLKNYGLRLQDSGTPKQLVIFMQAISERAAVDNQQRYLANQLGVIMANEYEQGDSTEPTLRSFLVSVVFSSCMDLAFTTTCGWIITMPLLQALQTTFDKLLASFDGTIDASRNAVTTTLHSALQCLQTVIYQSVRIRPALFRDPTMLKILTAGFAMTTAALPILDYISRSSRLVEEVFSPIRFLEAFGTFILARLHNADYINILPQIESLPIFANTEWAEARHFAHAELKHSLDKSWVSYDGQYYMTRGGSRKHISTELGSEEEERASLLIQVETFFESLRAMPACNGGECWEDSDLRPCLGMSELVI